MNLQNIMDSVYIIPVIFDHLENPTNITRTILKENKITKKTLDDFKKLILLMEYHEKHMENYSLLQAGLKSYFELKLSSVFRDLGLVAQEMFVLDYGCGTGMVSYQFKQDNPLSTIYMMDKTDYTGGRAMLWDFEKDPEWYHRFINQFELIILSEVLHCKSNCIQEYLIDSSIRMLRPNGKIVIIENIDHCMAWRIGKIKGGSYPVINASRVSELTNGDFILLKHIQIEKHIAYLYQKI